MRQRMLRSCLHITHTHSLTHHSAHLLQALSRQKRLNFLIILHSNCLHDHQCSNCTTNTYTQLANSLCDHFKCPFFIYTLWKTFEKWKLQFTRPNQYVKSICERRFFFLIYLLSNIWVQIRIIKDFFIISILRVCFLDGWPQTDAISHH